MTDALVPETFATPVPESIEDVVIEGEDLEMANLATHPGWRKVKTDIEERIKVYRQMQFEDGLSNEEVGKRYRIACQVALDLETVLRSVESRYEHATKRD